MSKILFRLNGSVVFTRDYQRGWGNQLVERGTSAIITDVQTGYAGGVTNLTVRLDDGRSLKEVPVHYFSTS
jgi:hypothetical protein